MINPLKDKVALVTGASQGIGRAIAEELSRAGAVVGLLARNRHPLENVAQALAGDSFIVPCNLESDVEISRLPKSLGRRIDILIHSAGVYSQGPFSQSSIEDLDRQYHVNLRAPYLLTLTLLHQLQQIVFINSTQGVSTRPHVAAYAASKHGLKALADCLRQELAPKVRVISVYPGKVATPMQQRRHQLEAKPYHPEKLIQPADVAAAVVNALALPRTADITDLHLRPGLSA
jgi:short-subunit dehydrogenase